MRATIQTTVKDYADPSSPWRLGWREAIYVALSDGICSGLRVNILSKFLRNHRQPPNYHRSTRGHENSCPNNGVRAVALSHSLRGREWIRLSSPVACYRDHDPCVERGVGRGHEG